jgi:hypothetical protein
MNATKLKELLEKLAPGRHLANVRFAAQEYGVWEKTVRRWLEKAGKAAVPRHDALNATYLDMECLEDWLLTQPPRKKRRKKS